jgi:hypothetical protein
MRIMTASPLSAVAGLMAAMVPVGGIAADMAPIKPLKAPPTVAVSADDRASFEMEGKWESTRFAPPDVWKRSPDQWAK